MIDSRPAAFAMPRAHGLLRDVVMLAKPRITALVVFTTGVGFAVAPGPLSPARLLATLAGLVLVVAGANTLNQWLERDTDGRMERTKSRPLPAGRMQPEVALVLGLAWAAAGLPLLAALVGAGVALLAAFALVAYVVFYTPLKRVTPLALWVGAVPGALPPLIGWTAATGRVSAPGVLLFAILFMWQAPHFLAVALFRKSEYARAGLRVLPVASGEDETRRQIVAWTVVLVVVSLLPLPLRVAGRVYLVAAGVLGAGFLTGALRGLRRGAGDSWARGLFIYSLVYLTGLLAALVVDARL